MSLVNASHTPPTMGPPDMTVLDACAAMAAAHVASIGLVDEAGRLVGLFQEQDLALRVVPARLDPATTLVRDVMTAPPRVIAPDREFAEALAMMMEHHLRHLPIVDEGGHLLGVLSLRSMMQWKIEDLDNEIREVTNYLGADGIGG